MRIEIFENELFKKLLEQNYNINLFNLPIGVAIDSRLHQKGDIYIPIVGENFDGHDFIPQINNNSPSLIISEKNINSEFPILQVENNRETVRQIVNLWRNQLNSKIIGITGSNGKTTTKDLAYHVISPSIESFKTDKNYNTVLSSPLSFLSAKQSQKVAIIEMGTNQPGEIKSICDVFEPNIGLITNVSNAHAENFNSIEDIGTEKGYLFNCLKKDGIAIVNNDDKLVSKINTNAKKITYGFNSKVDFLGIQIGERKLSVNGIEINLPFSGFAFAQNALAVFALSSVLGIDEKLIANTISDFNLPKGRGQILKINDITIIDDTYNANPSSMIAGLSRLINRDAKRKIAILGDMFELGQFEQKAHEGIGNFLLNAPIDIVISTGNRMKYVHQILKENKASYWFESKSEIIDYLNKNLVENDLVYLKGSRSMQMEKIIEGLN